MPVSAWDKPRFSPYFTQWKPSLSQGQIQFVSGTGWVGRAAEQVYVLKAYVLSALAIKGAFLGVPQAWSEGMSGARETSLGQAMSMEPLFLSQLLFTKL